MPEVLSKLYIALAVVLLFSATIFVHEFGHYWVARRRKMRVDAFAIGFGPKIFSWMRDGVEWSVRWIPAGGFVKLPQMITSEAIEGRADGQEHIPPASPLSKILVSFAGPLMNVIFAFLIATVLYFVGLPVLVNPPIIGHVDPQSAEGKLGIREGDKVVAVNGEAIRSWEDVLKTTVFARTNILPVEIERNGVRTTYQLTAERNEGVGFKMLNLDPRGHPTVYEVTSGSAAEAAGLKKGDEFLRFAGVPVLSQTQLIELIQKRPGQATELEVRRAGETLKLSVTPQPDPATKVARIGVALGSSRVAVYQVQRPGPPPHESVFSTVIEMRNTLMALIYSKQTGVSAKDLSGPPGIIASIAAEFHTDYRLALRFLILLNINLAILNLLPIPVLDGGHILMALYEMVARRRVSLRLQEYATTVFAVLLISFMLYVSFNDVQRFPLFKSLFERETRIEETSSSNPTPR